MVFQSLDVMRPQSQRVRSRTTAKVIVARVLDGKPDVVLLYKIDGFDDVRLIRRVHIVRRYTPERAVTARC